VASRPLYLAILEHLKAAGCAGATVTRGAAGFGAHSQIHTATILRSIDLPVIITAVDTPEKIEGILPEISEMLSGGLISSMRRRSTFIPQRFEAACPTSASGMSCRTPRPSTRHPDRRRR